MQAAKILIASQDHALRSDLRHGLQLGGLFVAEATNGREALDILMQEPPDLVLLDLRIPVVSSIALLAELRAMPSRQRPRAIVMADPADVPLALEAIALGASDFLQKPIPLQDARTSIASVLWEMPQVVFGTEEPSEILEAVHAALQAGTFGSIDSALMNPGQLPPAACLNLAGLVHEAHGRLDSASEFYERAVALDTAYWPAHENLERLRELRDYGETNRHVCFRELLPGPASGPGACRCAEHASYA
jgi:two-component system response regulator (stage 0 sporulation protein F)